MTAKPEFNGWEHAKRSIAFVTAHVAAALKVSGLWLVLIAAAIVGAGPLLIWLVENNEGVAAGIRSLEDQRVVQLIILVPTIVLMAIGWPSVAVAWHRFVLRREQPAVLPFAPLRGGLYLLLSAAFYIVVWILPGAALAYAFYAVQLQINLVIALLWLAIFIGLMALSMRFSLKLPAIAVSDRSMTLARSWSETEAIWPGMLWGTVVLTVPAYLLTRALDAIVKRLPDEQTALTVFLSVANLAVIFIGLLLYATFLSITYQRAVGETSTTFD